MFLHLVGPDLLSPLAMKSHTPLCRYDAPFFLCEALQYASALAVVRS